MSKRFVALFAGAMLWVLLWSLYTIAWGAGCPLGYTESAEDGVCEVAPTPTPVNQEEPIGMPWNVRLGHWIAGESETLADLNELNARCIAYNEQANWALRQCQEDRSGCRSLLANCDSEARADERVQMRRRKGN